MIRSFVYTARYWSIGLRAVLKSRLFWAFLGALAAIFGLISLLPTGPVTLFISAVVSGFSVAIILTQFNAVVEFFDPLDARGRPCARTLGHWYAVSWWVAWFFVFLTMGYRYTYVYLLRPKWMAELPVFNMMMVLILISAVIQTLVPYMVGENDEDLTVRVSNLQRGKAAHAAVIAGVCTIAILLWLS
jgi:hypothetical protein